MRTTKLSNEFLFDQNPIIIEEKFLTSKGELAKRKYLKGRFLGKGGFARCFELTNLETKEMHAAKIFQKANLSRSRHKRKLLTEIQIHRSL